MQVAEETRVPAGDALAVDRQAFAERITARAGGQPRGADHPGRNHPHPP